MAKTGLPGKTRGELLCRKRILLLGATFCLATAFADKVNNDPVYTVDLDSSASNLLSAVAITKTVGGETVASSYDELQAETAAGTLVKKGAGWLVIAEALANWTGQIHVDEGVVQVACRGGLGKEKVPSSKTSTTYATDDDATFVASGATLFMDSSLLEKKVRNESKKIVFEGEGAEGLGGAIVTYARNLSASAAGNQSWWFGQNPTLSGDATVMMDTAGTRTMFFSDPNYAPMPILDLGGHTLRLVHAPDNAVTFNHNAALIRNGNIIADKIDYHFQNNGSAFGGGAECKLVFTNKSVFSWESVTSFAAGTRGWTVDLSGATEWAVSGTAGGYSSVDTNAYGWYGPVEINQDTLKIRKSTSAGLYGLTFGGPISGRGGIGPYNGNATNIWLHLLNSDNTFQGGVEMANGGIVEVFANGALPANGGPLQMTNGIFYAINGEVEDYEEEATANEKSGNEPALCRRFKTAYELPSAIFSGTGLVRVVEAAKDVDTPVVTVGKPGCWKDRFVKKGMGELLYEAALGAPELDIQGGGVKLGFTGAGLYETHVDYNQCKGGVAPFYQSGILLSNVVVRSARMAYTRGKPDWVGNTAIVYEGYLWNRANENVNWSFAVAINYEGVVFLDDEEILRSKNVGGRATVSVAPGAHHFVLRMYTTGGVGGVTEDYPAQETPSKFSSWPANTCFWWDPEGKDSGDVKNDYVRLSDPGDGSVVTLTADGAAPDLDGFLPKFGKITFGGAGTYLDLNGNNFTVDEVEGLGEIRNSNALWPNRTFTIRTKLTLPGAQLPTATLAVAGKLAFGENATVELADTAKLPRTDVTFLSATEGLVGLPTLSVGTDRSRHYRLKATPDGKSLKLVYQPGAYVILR